MWANQDASAIARSKAAQHARHRAYTADYAAADYDAAASAEPVDAPSPPRSGASHAARRAKTPPPRVSVKRSALTALGIGLAITAPVALQHGPVTDLSLGGSGTDGSAPTNLNQQGAALPADGQGAAGAGGAAGKGAQPPTSGGQASEPAGPADVSGSGHPVSGPTPVARHATNPPPPLASPATPGASNPLVPAASGAPSPSGSGPAVPGTSASAPTSLPASPAPSADTPAVQLSPTQAASYEDQVIALTNAQRAMVGCVALRPDARLQTAAIQHSVDMNVHHYFAHDTPSGVTPWTRIEAQGYANPSAENIAMGQLTPAAVVAAWMASPGHRANILNCQSKAIGVGVQLGPGGPWWTQDFGYS